MENESTLALFEWLLQHKNIQLRLYVKKTVILVIEFNF